MKDMKDNLFKDFDKELLHGAKNTLEICLSTTKNDKLTIITDEASIDISSAFAFEAQHIGVKYNLFILEEFGKRPILAVPVQIIKSMSESTVSLLMVRREPGELNFRFTILDLVKKYNIKHAHMPGVDRSMMITGMQADYRKVSALQDRLLAFIKKESIIRTQSNSGTDLVVTIDENYRWKKSDGIITPGQWQNIPSGQLFTVPGTIEGIYVVDSSIGDWFSEKYPDLYDYPLTIEIENNRVVNAKSKNSQLARSFMFYIHSNQDGDRIGEFGLGTNIFFKSLVGNPLQDENYPGVHLSVGDPLGSETGANWASKTRVSVIGKDFDVEIDGKIIMKNSNYEDELLKNL